MNKKNIYGSKLYGYTKKNKTPRDENTVDVDVGKDGKQGEGGGNHGDGIKQTMSKRHEIRGKRGSEGRVKSTARAAM